MTNFVSLPDEMILEIFKKVDSPRHLGYLSCVDLRFNNILSSSEIWNNLLLNHHSDHYFQYVDYDHNTDQSVQKNLVPQEKIQEFLQNEGNYNKSRSVIGKYFETRKQYYESTKTTKAMSLLFHRKLFDRLKVSLFFLYVAPLIASLIFFIEATTKYGWFKLVTFFSIPFYFCIIYFLAYIHLSKKKMIIKIPDRGWPMEIVTIITAYLLIFFFYTLIIRSQDTTSDMIYSKKHSDLDTLMNMRTKLFKSNSNENSTPLILASKNSNIEIVNELLRRDANVDSFDLFDFSALGYACYYANYEIAKTLLLKQGINFTKTQQIKDFCDDRYLFNFPLYLKDNTLLESKNNVIIKPNNFWIDIYYFFTYIFTKGVPLELQINNFFLEKRTNQTFQVINKRSSKMREEFRIKLQYFIYYGNNFVETRKKNIRQNWDFPWKDYSKYYGYSQVKNTINNLYLDQDSKDFVIDINGKELYVHKFILNSYSKYFHSLIQRRPRMTIYVEQFNYDYIIWEKLISFLYRQKLDENLNILDLSKIENLAQTIQISSNSSLSLEIIKYKTYIKEKNYTL
ncbi:ankyrin repeat and ef-hand domain-containing protein [Anaeramoeba flamelloides]|uniref:Ankyrin repeat and ef-hand domain-containing protein n=1 Tax=Anaeramoeba flamelloides TaxID=1746091 RepID=A0ABQ8XKB1_9EUKA|nr:ankyrin repeat and ef-hand domain-containing protein [Anaeramoeba flamelloides]